MQLTFRVLVRLPASHRSRPRPATRAPSQLSRRLVRSQPTPLSHPLSTSSSKTSCGEHNRPPHRQQRISPLPGGRAQAPAREALAVTSITRQMSQETRDKSVTGAEYETVTLISLPPDWGTRSDVPAFACRGPPKQLIEMESPPVSSRAARPVSTRAPRPDQARVLGGRGKTLPFMTALLLFVNRRGIFRR
jgi:hypothetical protein